jgi:hypothetical protein
MRFISAILSSWLRIACRSDSDAAQFFVTTPGSATPAPFAVTTNINGANEGAAFDRTS